MEKLLRYIVEEAPADAESKQAFKFVILSCGQLRSFILFFELFSGKSFLVMFRFPFVACEIFTCEIDVILKTLVEEEEVWFYFFVLDH